MPRRRGCAGFRKKVPHERKGRFAKNRDPSFQIGRGHGEVPPEKLSGGAFFKFIIYKGGILFLI